MFAAFNPELGSYLSLNLPFKVEMLRSLLHLLSAQGAKSTSSSHACHTMLTTPVQIRGLSEIISRYDLVLFDQFGVMHDGRALLPQAIDTLRQLHEKNKKVVVLSNSSNRADKALQRLHRMGFVSVDNILTSGELAWSHLSSKYRRSRCCWVTWASFRDDSYLADLGMTTSDIDEADLLLLHGSQIVVGDPVDDPTHLDFMNNGVIDDALETVLRRAAQRSIPVVCANMDLTAVLASGALAYMPGTLLERYRQLGGETATSFGKPQLQFFEAALEMGYGPSQTPLQRRQRETRTLHIGDSLLHDIAGAAGANLDSLLVTKHGVHKNELYPGHASSEETPLLIRVCDEADRLGAPRPTFVIEELVF